MQYFTVIMYSVQCICMYILQNTKCCNYSKMYDCTQVSQVFYTDVFPVLQTIVACHIIHTCGFDDVTIRIYTYVIYKISVFKKVINNALYVDNNFACYRMNISQLSFYLSILYIVQCTVYLEISQFLRQFHNTMKAVFCNIITKIDR